MGTAQNLRMCMPGWRFELVASQFDPVAQRIAEIDRPHETPINATGIGNSTLVEAFGDLVVSRQTDLEGDVMRRPDMVRNIAGRHTIFCTEDRYQASVTRVEVQMADFRGIEIRLLEHKRHPQETFPEIDTGLAISTVQGDVVYALGLYPSHLPPQSANC